MKQDSPVSGAIFDLDDTLYLQSRWLQGAWEAVADAARTEGIDGDGLLRQLVAVCAEGSDGGRIIDRALERVGAQGVGVEPLLDAFRAHRPRYLEPYPGIKARLAELRQVAAVALLTDGDPEIQRSKLAALGLERSFDYVIITDEMGRECRKPDPRAYARALALVAAPPSQVIFVGDRPDKDVEGPRQAGMRAIRVRMGEYAATADRCPPWITTSNPVKAVDEILAAMRAGDRRGGACRLR